MNASTIVAVAVDLAKSVFQFTVADEAWNVLESNVSPVPSSIASSTTDPSISSSWKPAVPPMIAVGLGIQVKLLPAAYVIGGGYLRLIR